MRLGKFTKLVGSLAICLAAATTAPAQYGGGGGTGGTGGTGATGSGTPSYSSGSGKAIGIGVGVAAGAAVGIVLLVRHHHKTHSSQALLIGCAQSASGGISLKSEGDGVTYVVIPKGKTVQPGERVEIKGMLENDQTGTPAFRVRDVIADFGACSEELASTYNTKPLSLELSAQP